MLDVKHIIVCSHYGCGGIRAAMENAKHGLIDNWLCHIKDINRLNTEKLSRLNQDEKFDLLCELNVKQQVVNVCNTTIVQKAWGKGVAPSVHGWIYNIENGIRKTWAHSNTSIL